MARVRYATYIQRRAEEVVAGRVKKCAEDTTETGDPATTFGIALLSLDVCYGDVVSSLLRRGSGLGSGPTVWHAFPFSQNNNNINILSYNIVTKSM